MIKFFTCLHHFKVLDLGLEESVCLVTLECPASISEDKTQSSVPAHQVPLNVYVIESSPSKREGRGPWYQFCRHCKSLFLVHPINTSDS